ncbi:MAG: preprotein translocase subunit SecG [Alphaproteobacteria bacterium]|nr:preprotein translocase subunit SecG [Alphaproteobacteria bacterium]QQS58576.1 MAG: preprotein translocase subunit SecG [Alphaproteobacteria bacterium]
MQSVVLVIHLILALAIIGLVLLQRSEGGGLGIGNSGGIGNFASAKGTANALTRMTAIFALGFFITSLSLGILAARQSTVSRGILEQVDAETLKKAEAEAPVQTGPQIEFSPPEKLQEAENPEGGTEDGPSAPVAGGEGSKDAQTPEKTSEPLKEEKAPQDAVSLKESPEKVKPEEKATPEASVKQNPEETKAKDSPVKPADKTEPKKD